jgi:uncharacterized protein (DUF305 family)
MRDQRVGTISLSPFSKQRDQIMKPYLRFIAAAALIILPATAFAQADPHHPDAGAGAPPAPAATPSAPSATPAPGPMPGGPPDQSAAMMQMMQQMMPMMQQMMQMMQGGMMGGQMGGMPSQGGMMGGGMGGMAMPGGSMSEASNAYMDAMKKMDAPMMTALQAADPDVAFVGAMIPHHQGAIDMARAVLTHGKDEKVKAWAEQIIKAQEAEIAEMQAWLKERQQ